MVGHSQLESDMLESSPPPMAADGDNDSVVEPADAAAADEAPMAEDNRDDKIEAGSSGVDEAVQGVQNSPDRRAAAQGSPMHLPQPGRKRKRSSLCRGGRHDGAPVGPCLCCNMLPVLTNCVSHMLLHRSHQQRHCSDLYEDHKCNNDECKYCTCIIVTQFKDVRSSLNHLTSKSSCSTY